MQGWTGTVILVTIVVLNLLSQQTDKFLYDNHAYGLDYTVPAATYDRATISAMANDREASQRDAKAVLGILERWKQDNEALIPSGTKPPMVLINTSGGGLRSMLWTMLCLQYADSVADGSLMDRTALMTGSSGGLIGAAYYRQLYLAEQEGGTVDRFDKVLLNEVSADMLNSLTFSFVTNDMFVRYRTVKDGDLRYTLDRGYAFERRLNQATRGMLDVRLRDLAAAERDADVPLMVISPASINDGRRLVISSLPMAFLTNIAPEASVTSAGEAEAIDFQRMFHDQGADNLKLTSALRMNATFPYITPIVTLPSEPPMRVMDAGLRDNYGYRVSLAFLNTYRHWIKENTSGVVVLQLRDTQKELEVKPTSASLVGRVLDPVGSVYDNVVRVQDQDYDMLLQQASSWVDFPLEIVDIQLRHGDEEQISLSWHLTALERKRVLRSIRSAENQRAFTRFEELISEGSASPRVLAVGDSAPDPATGQLPLH
ncbi:MAG: patatin-like phospholipase family protein [Flavobacteriales bacterium]